MKFITFLLLVFCAISSGAQIPNASFENWTTNTGYSTPDSWGTMNHTTAAFSVYTVAKGTPGSSGSSYIKITSKTVNGGIVPGIAVSGELDTINLTAKSGFPFTQRPVSLTGKWQFMSYGGIPGGVSVKLSRWDAINGVRETVATGSISYSGMAHSWVTFNAALTYTSNAYPDTCIITLRASGVTAAANDFIWVDELSFSGTVAGDFENKIQNFETTVFPNPAASQATICLKNQTINNGKICLYDLLGEKIKEFTLLAPTQTIDTSVLNNGTYIFVCSDTQNKLLEKGIFLVKH